jgi:serine protease Do
LEPFTNIESGDIVMLKKTTIREAPGVGIAGAVVLAALMACGDAPALPGEAAVTPATRPVLGGSPLPLENDTTIAAALSATFRNAVEATLPAVVFVSVEREFRGPERFLPIPEEWRRFFGLPDEGVELPPQRGSGTGFMIEHRNKVVILTNNHVVADAAHVRIRLQDGRELAASVVAGDPTTDVAVMRLEDDVGRFPTGQIGSSDALRVGDWVLALGNPLGLDFTVTAGIVSAKGRQLTGRPTALESFIQTDAAINPGNSGGPLIDLHGRIVGINSAISGGAYFVGYGFAVPIDLAMRVVDDLIEYGHVRRPRLGVRVSDVTAVDAAAYGLDEVAGADINTVEEGSPADEAGLEIGDVIVALDGEPVPDATALTTSLAEYEPGDRVTVTVVRDGRRRDFSVSLSEFPPPEAEGVSETEPPEASRSETVLGFRVEALTPLMADELGHDRDAGVVVSGVEPFSEAARAGISVGQMVLRINNRVVERPDEVESIVSSLSPGAVVSIRVLDPGLGETIINYRTRP